MSTITLRDLIDRPTWMTDAACRTVGPNVMYPVTGGKPLAEAKRICRTCDVQVECAAYALANNETYGTWGGLGERERNRAKRTTAGLAVRSAQREREREQSMSAAAPTRATPRTATGARTPATTASEPTP